MDYQRSIMSPGRVQRGGFTVAAMLCYDMMLDYAGGVVRVYLILLANYYIICGVDRSK